MKLAIHVFELIPTSTHLTWIWESTSTLSIYSDSGTPLPSEYTDQRRFGRSLLNWLNCNLSLASLSFHTDLTAGCCCVIVLLMFPHLLQLNTDYTKIKEIFRYLLHHFYCYFLMYSIYQLSTCACSTQRTWRTHKSGIWIATVLLFSCCFWH